MTSYPPLGGNLSCCLWDGPKDRLFYEGRTQSKLNKYLCNKLKNNNFFIVKILDQKSLNIIRLVELKVVQLTVEKKIN